MCKTMYKKGIKVANREEMMERSRANCERLIQCDQEKALASTKTLAQAMYSIRSRKNTHDAEYIEKSYQVIKKIYGIENLSNLSIADKQSSKSFGDAISIAKDVCQKLSDNDFEESSKREKKVYYVQQMMDEIEIIANIFGRMTCEVSYAIEGQRRWLFF